MPQRHRLKRASPHAAVVSALALLLCTPQAWSGEEVSVLTMPQAVSDTPFASEREAVIWRREELKDIESLVRQLRFDLVNNQDFEAASPRLLELQERASAQRLLPAFIESTHGSGSEAKASIWEEWDDFAAGFTDLEDKITHLIDVAEQQNPRDTARALSEVGASCKSCHRAYRYD
ncbi:MULTISPECIES: cytochrome c [unclassified Halomonas]|uniref:c-type cytochrome n=1 Tax=unclassified Halomonas TaxID=2609666 RepID=UPI0007DA446C|nr:MULTISPECIES: cytochrome c [unclassified Halomonas]MBT2787922.1 cytochrome c [Halomonas sp. ISL-106]MBT2795671.1 cytochrome c [Halomonas sp. ISL-104]OAL60972.1 cytochrome C [Halomonas sp. ALS9]